MLSLLAVYPRISKLTTTSSFPSNSANATTTSTTTAPSNTNTFNPTCDVDDNKNYTEPEYGDGYTIKCNYDFDHGNNTAVFPSTDQPDPLNFADCIEKCSEWNRQDHTAKYYYDPNYPQYDFPPATLESYPKPGPYRCLGINYYAGFCYIKNSLDERNLFSYETSSALLTTALDTEPDNYTTPSSQPSSTPSTSRPSNIGTSGIPSNSANSTSGTAQSTGFPSNSANSTSGTAQSTGIPSNSANSTSGTASSSGFPSNSANSTSETAQSTGFPSKSANSTSETAQSTGFPSNSANSTSETAQSTGFPSNSANSTSGTASSSGFPSISANSTSGVAQSTGSTSRSQPSNSITNSANSTSARSDPVISFSYQSWHFLPKTSPTFLSNIFHPHPGRAEHSLPWKHAAHAKNS